MGLPRYGQADEVWHARETDVEDPLVPKLRLGTRLSSQLRCLVGRTATKRSFARTSIPKQSLGTRGYSCGLAPR
jgi:hypothetical protein